MRTWLCALCMVASLFLLFGRGEADIISSLSFNSNQFELSNIVERDSNTYTQIRGIGDAAYSFPGNPGDPELPAITLLYSLPFGMEVDEVAITNTSETQLAQLDYLPHPIQPGWFPDSSQPAFVPPGTIYAQTETYPFSDELAECTNRVSFMRGAAVAAIIIKPIRYDPVNERLFIVQNISITISVRSASSQPLLPLRESILTHDEFVKSLKSIVQNTSDVDGNLPSIPIISNWSHSINPRPTDCLVIVGGQLGFSWNAYREYMTAHGYSTEIVTVNYIYANYQGRDNPEKIRNYIIEKYYNDGLGFVMLGTDIGLVPSKICLVDSWGEVLTDLYFSCLDGDWDSNQNGYVCDGNDLNIDLGADIMAARVPSKMPNDISAWWQKRNRYENNPGNGNPEYIAQTIIASADQPRSQLCYQDMARPLGRAFYVDTTTLREEPSGDSPNPSQPSASDVINILNNGTHIFEVMGHGAAGCAVLRSYGYNESREPSWLFTTNELRQITGGKDHITFSINCLLGMLDTGDQGGCFAQIDLTSVGGSVAARYNSRTVNIIDEHEGASLDATTMAFIVDDGLKLSRSHYYAKLLFQGLGRGNGTRERILANNLFGCPIMNVWTSMPEQLAVTYPSKIIISGGDMPSPSQILVTVRNKNTNQPIPGAYVTLMKGGEVYDRAVTNANGVALIWEYFETTGFMSICVTMPNYLPFQGQISITSTLGMAKPQETLPALVWNPKHIESGDSILSSLALAGYQAIQTDSLALFSDSLDSYFLFVMGGMINYPYLGIDYPDFAPHRSTIDSFIVNGGRVYWEGLMSLNFCCCNNEPDSILANSILACYPGDTLNDISYIQGMIAGDFANIDSLIYHGGRISRIVCNNNRALCINDITDGCIAAAVTTEWGLSRTIASNFYWSNLRDDGNSARQDLIIDIMNWLSGSQEKIEEITIPTLFSLSQNYPNPFNAQTTITYSLPKSSTVSIDIYDILGRKIDNLISERQEAGNHSIIWDAKDVSSGIYFYKIKADDFTDTKRCLLLK